MADQGASASFILIFFLKEIRTHLPTVLAKKISPSLNYHHVLGDPWLTCVQSAKLDVFLQIRHGASIILRNMNWMVTEEDLKALIIGRRVLEFAGCENKDTLLAVHDKLEDDIDVTNNRKENGNEKENEGVTADLYGKSVFYRGSHVQEDGLRDEVLYVKVCLQRIGGVFQRRRRERSVRGKNRKAGANHKSKQVCIQNKAE